MMEQFFLLQGVFALRRGEGNERALPAPGRELSPLHPAWIFLWGLTRERWMRFLFLTINMGLIDKAWVVWYADGA